MCSIWFEHIKKKRQKIGFRTGVLLTHLLLGFLLVLPWSRHSQPVSQLNQRIDVQEIHRKPLPLSLPSRKIAAELPLIQVWDSK